MQYSGMHVTKDPLQFVGNAHAHACGHAAYSRLPRAPAWKGVLAVASRGLYLKRLHEGATRDGACASWRRSG
eukprot:354265-Chlamydomonas_euryale.AAC.6